jgi:hypothetical protein
LIVSERANPSANDAALHGRNAASILCWDVSRRFYDLPVFDYQKATPFGHFQHLRSASLSDSPIVQWET